MDGSALGLEADFLGSPGLYAERRSTHGRPKHYRRRRKKKDDDTNGDKFDRHEKKEFSKPPLSPEEVKEFQELLHSSTHLKFKDQSRKRRNSDGTGDMETLVETLTEDVQELRSDEDEFLANNIKYRCT